MENVSSTINLLAEIYQDHLNYILQNEVVKRFVWLLQKCLAYLGLINFQKIEDSFHQLLLEKNYDEALGLAQSYDFLDIDLVYKCKWTNSTITQQSIKTVLGNIRDKLWVISECVHTVPISYDTCEKLIDFGLENANLKFLYHLGDSEVSTRIDNKTSSISPTDSYRNKSTPQLSKNKKHLDRLEDKDFEPLIDFATLNEAQKDLCKYRQELISYKKSLLTYGEILGDYKTIVQHFDHVFYDELRQKNIFDASIDYAHDGDSHAVKVLFDLYFKELKAHYLPIISSFPETLAPLHYKDLLPQIRDGLIIFPIKQSKIEDDSEFDWSLRCKDNRATIDMSESFNSQVSQFYSENTCLKKFKSSLDVELIQDWYLFRSRELEKHSLWPSHSIQLLKYGIEIGVESLEELLYDLDEFDKFIYDCCPEDKITMSFEEFNAIELVDKLILMTGDNLKDCKNKFRFYVFPFLHRRRQKLDITKREDILKQYFRKLANHREKNCRLIYNDLLDRIESDDIVTEWTEGLDDVIDAIGEEIEVIERKRQMEALSNLASKTLALEEYDECYEACQMIMRKNYTDCCQLCYQLGMKKDFRNNEAKYKLLAFALTHCPDEDGRLSSIILEYVIELRRRDEAIQFEYFKLNSTD